VIRRGVLVLLAAMALGALAPPAAAGSANVAALQVALKAEGLYRGDIDGIRGPATAAAVRAFQRRKKLVVDGVAGRATRRALGRRGGPRVGSRVMRRGHRGWDVAALQFMLGRHGWPSGGVDGGFGLRTDYALRRFQRWARIGADGLAGAGTLHALRRRAPRSPLTMRRPMPIGLSSSFGPRGTTFHTGVDFPGAMGAAVRAARRGTVTWAGWRVGGWGYTVSIAHGRGVRSMYAHLSRIHVRRGQRVRAGRVIGAVGSTGRSSGPHLHFEVRFRGAAVDPMTAFR